MILQGIDPLVLALFLGSLSLMPMLLIICTSFLKIVIVLMITRNAIGVQQVPPSMAINGIALAATLFIMAPVGYEIAQNIKASPVDTSSVQRLLDTGLEAIQPLRAFMLRNTDPDVLTHLLENSARMPFGIKLVAVGITLVLTGRWIGLELIQLINLMFDMIARSALN